MRKECLFIDPPSGWRYGFPKEAPENIREMGKEELHIWLVANGYPREEIDFVDGDITCRFFVQEVNDEDA